jgi:hypothetical protein
LCSRFNIFDRSILEEYLFSSWGAPTLASIMVMCKYEMAFLLHLRKCTLFWKSNNY